MSLVAACHTFLNVQLLGAELTEDAAIIQAVACGESRPDERNIHKQKADEAQPKRNPLARGGTATLNGPVIATLDALVTRDGQLGPAPRFAALVLVVAEAWDEPLQVDKPVTSKLLAARNLKLMAELERQHRDLTGVSLEPDWASRACRDWFPTDPRGHPVRGSDLAIASTEKLALLALLNMAPHRARLPPLTWEVLMHRPLRRATSVPDAIQAFRDWLCDGTCFTAPAVQRQWLTELSGTVAAQSAAVRRAAQAITRLASLGERRPLVQLCARWRPSLARAVAARVEADGVLPVIHLQAARLDDPGHACTLKQFLHPLTQAFGVDTGRLDEAFASAAEQARVVDLLRRGLTRHPCIVVVDGLANASGRQAAAVDFVTGISPLIDLVRSLALPQYETPGRTAPREERTLWVVCVLHPVAAWLPFTEARFNLDAARWDDGAGRWTQTWVADSNPKGKPLSVLTGQVGRLSKTRAAWVAGKAPPSDLALVLVNTNSAFGSRPRREIPPAGDEAQALLLMTQLLQHLHRTDPAGFWLMALVSATAEGLCLGTLRRIAKATFVLLELNELAGPAERQALEALLRTFHGGGPAADFPGSALAPYQPCLAVFREQVSDHLGARVLRWEVGELAEIPPVSEGAHAGAYRQCLHFASPVLRDLALDALTKLDPKMDKVLALIQYATAIDAFSQASALLSNAASVDLVNLARKRLLVQALHHLGCAGDIQGCKLQDPLGRIGASHFPVDALRRRRVAYCVVYRSLIEERGAWLLSRRYARHDLRVAVLLGLVEWGQPSRPYAGVDAPGWQHLESSRRPRRGLAGCAVQAAGSDGGERFMRQMLNNLSVAAVDAQDALLADAAMDALEKASSAQAAAPLLSRQVALGPLMLQLGIADLRHERRSQRLVFTQLDDAGLRPQARRLCEQRVRAVQPDLLERVRQVADALAHTLVSAPDVVSAYATQMMPRMLKLTQLAQPSAESHVDAADWCVRLADVLANETDDCEAPPLRQVVQAWLVFWVADMLRAKAGEQPSLTASNWPRVNSRYFRSGIRLTLKLARRLAEARGVDPLGLKALADYALQFASDRIGVLARDYNALARDLFHVQLLRGALARTYARMHKSPEALADAAAYLREAEERWLMLGGPGELTRRLLVERLSLGEALLRLRPRDNRPARLQVLRADLRLLDGFVSHAGQARTFWDRWAQRHRRRIEGKAAA